MCRSHSERLFMNILVQQMTCCFTCNTIFTFFLFTFSIFIMFSLIPSDANDAQGLIKKKKTTTKKTKTRKNKKQNIKRNKQKPTSKERAQNKNNKNNFIKGFLCRMYLEKLVYCASTEKCIPAILPATLIPFMAIVKYFRISCLIFFDI